MHPALFPAFPPAYQPRSFSPPVNKYPRLLFTPDPLGRLPSTDSALLVDSSLISAFCPQICPLWWTERHFGVSIHGFWLPGGWRGGEEGRLLRQFLQSHPFFPRRPISQLLCKWLAMNEFSIFLVVFWRREILASC